MSSPPLSPPILPMVPTPAPQAGSIQAILGPMFSGKSTELLRRMKRYTIAKNNCVLVKYSKDTRYSVECVSTHDKQEMRAVSAEVLMPLADEMQAPSVIGIDEGQFFPDLIEFCETMANRGKTVIVAALDGTFQRKPFGSVLELIPLAEHVVKLNAVCFNCARDAPFSKRIVEGTEVEVIGGADKYVAACRTCFFLPQGRKIEAVTPSTSFSTLPLNLSDKLKQTNLGGSAVESESSISKSSTALNRQLFPESAEKAH